MNLNLKKSFSFLMVGKTQESADAGEGFKRYVGLGASKILAVNPTKEELEKIYGREIQNDPEYIIERDDQKGVRVDIIVQSVPELNNGIECITHATFNLYPTLAYNKDQSKVRVVDNYGNSTWANTEDAKAGKAILSHKGEPMKFDSVKYRMAFSGEVELLDFLRKFLYNKDAFRLVNGTWTKQSDAEDVIIGFENPKKLLSGDVSEVKELINLQPDNKIKLLYGVRTTEEGKQYQTICTGYDLMLRNNSSTSALPGLERNLASAKQSGMYSTTDFRVQELQEYNVEATNLEKSVESSNSSDAMPWD